MQFSKISFRQDNENSLKPDVQYILVFRVYSYIYIFKVFKGKFGYLVSKLRIYNSKDFLSYLLALRMLKLKFLDACLREKEISGRRGIWMYKLQVKV